MTKKICTVEHCEECPYYKEGKQYVNTFKDIDYYHHCKKSGAYHETIEGLWKTCPLPDVGLNHRNYIKVPKIEDMLKTEDTISIIEPNNVKRLDDKHPPKSISWGG